MLDALIRQSGRYRRNLLGTLRALPSRLEDRGAVAAEFALLLPAQVLMFGGVFGIGAVMIEYAQLNYVVQCAAQVEAGWTTTPAGNGALWAGAQIPPPATFATIQPAQCGGQLGAEIVGYWPVNLGIFPALTLSAHACSPLPLPKSPPPP
jgi:hypothetical protein